MYAKKLPSIQSFNSESSSEEYEKPVEDDNVSIDSNDTIYKHCQTIFEKGQDDD